jgi:hypothetical protein
MPANWKTSVQSKSLLIAIAAFALTSNSAFAYSGEVLERAGLTESQRNAFETARELSAHGDKEKARDVLVDAGIDTSVIERVRDVATSVQTNQKEVSSPKTYTTRHSVSELTESEQQAYQVALMANDREAMDAILEEAGIGGRGGSFSQKYLKDGRELL